ncbi:hypothetical protein [Hydrogenophaga sp. ANAO-22]|uniref:hypothetical protein n=1 Tax=Hydrogenophaga sp. ANAO-22 TaxID=3166645 RepID=UPI0036D370BA
MNVNFAHHWPAGPMHLPEHLVATAKALIDADETEQLEQLGAMLEQGVITANTPSGENGETLLIYAVRQSALFSFLDMVAHPGAGDLNETDWDGNSAWHAMALHLNNGVFESSGWLDHLDELLEDNPHLQIDWGLRNMHNQTPLDVALHLDKQLIAGWIAGQMEPTAIPSMNMHIE